MEEEGSTVWLDICASRGTPGTCEEERSCACKVPQLFSALRSAQFVWHHLSEQGCVRVTGSVVLYMVKAARGLYFALCVGVNWRKMNPECHCPPKWGSSARASSAQQGARAAGAKCALCDTGTNLVFYALEGCQCELHSTIIPADLPGNSMFAGLCSGTSFQCRRALWSRAVLQLEGTQRDSLADFGCASHCLHEGRWEWQLARFGSNLVFSLWEKHSFKIT